MHVLNHQSRIVQSIGALRNLNLARCGLLDDSRKLVRAPVGAILFRQRWELLSGTNLSSGGEAAKAINGDNCHRPK